MNSVNPFNSLKRLDGLHRYLDPSAAVLLQERLSVNISSGTSIPATFFAMYSAMRADLRG